MESKVLVNQDADVKKAISSAKFNNAYFKSNVSTPPAPNSIHTLSNKSAVNRDSALLKLQQTHGNQYVQKIVGMQAKLKINKPEENYEHKAGRATEHVMRISENVHLIQRASDFNYGPLSDEWEGGFYGPRKNTKSVTEKEKPNTQPISELAQKYLSDARMAINYTHKALFLGMGNWWNKPDDPRFLRRTEGGNFWNASDDFKLGPIGGEVVPELTLIMKRITEFFEEKKIINQINNIDKATSELKKLEDDDPSFSSITRERKMQNLSEDKQKLLNKYVDLIAKTGKSSGIGNCNEHAAVGYQFLRDNTRSRPIELVAKSDHAFILIGRTKGKVVNPASWNPETVVCDPYYGEYYVVNDEILHKEQIGVNGSMIREE